MQALLLARQFVQSGMNECCLALGVEKMKPGSLGGDMDGGATMLDYHMVSSGDCASTDLIIPTGSDD